MKSGTPFRAAMLMGQALAALAAVHAPGTALFMAGLSDIGPYQGRGKGRTARHNRGGTRAYQRAALKTRNRAQHRKACRG